MEPRIQYAQTKDGVSIAYWMLGEGMPLVFMPDLPASHIQYELQYPQYRRWYERLAENRKVVRYDGRGSGLSERDVADFTLDAYVLDLDAVVDHIGLETFGLFGHYAGGPVSIAYAARHPERVSHLILWCAWARASDIWRLPQIEALALLAEKDWNTFTETFAHVSFGWPEGDEARQYAVTMRESITQEAFRTAIDAMRRVDVSDVLPHLSSPTLVLQRRQVPYPDVDVARRLASRIPEARLSIVEGKSPNPWADSDAVLTAIDEFLGEGEEAAAAPSGLVTILFTDMEGSTASAERLGDARAQELLRTHNSIVRDALKTHSGSEVKHTGDGIMASFGSATRALECAVAMQRALAQHNESAPEPIKVRVGLNAGEPIAEDEDLFGTAVNEAARITAAAKGGEILAANVVRELAKGKDFLFADRGETSLRGFEDPVRLFEVRWREEG